MLCKNQTKSDELGPYTLFHYNHFKNGTSIYNGDSISLVRTIPSSSWLLLVVALEIFSLIIKMLLLVWKWVMVENWFGLVWFGNFDYLSRSVVDSSTFMIRSPSRSSFNPLPCFVSCCSSILNTTSPFCYYAKQRRCTLYSTPAGTMTVTKCSPPRGAKKDARCIITWSILCSDLQERVTSTMVCVHR